MISDRTRYLVKKLNKGSINAFDELFKIYSGKIFNFTRFFLKSIEEAEEITQEVFVAVWENRSKIDPKKSFSSYIFGIAKNKIFNLIRQKVHYIQFIEKNSEENEIINDEKNFLNKELQNLINECIENLPPKRKEIFKLSREEGLTYKEIAEKLNISENTVDVQIRKSLKQLQEVLKNYLF